MIFGIIDPKREVFELKDFDHIKQAELYAGLTLHHTDHGTMSPRIGTITYEFALFEEKNFFFSVGRRLYAGAMVLYEIEERGGTCDFGDDLEELVRKHLIFYPSLRAAEVATIQNEVLRPELAVNGSVYWQWPGPKPDWMK